MAGAIRLVSVERGLDPARFVSMTFGGAGALHACKLIRATGLGGAVIPRYPGVISAFGCLIADFRHDVVRTVNLDVAAVDPAALAGRLADAERQLRAFLVGSGLTLEDPSVRHEFDMAYEGQTHTIVVDAPALEDLAPASIQEAFDRAYLAAYGRVLEGVRTRLLSFRTVVIGRRPRIDPLVFAPSGDRADQIGSPRGQSRPVFIAGRWVDTPILPRLDLPVGAVVEGPKILEQPDATTVLEPGFAARVDDFGNLIIEQAPGP